MPRLLTPNRDYITEDLAIYLKDNLNAGYTDKIVVRSVRGYDAANVPLTDFPLLKCYRLTDSYQRGTTFSLSTAAITYALSFPEVDALPGILKYVSDSINYYLLKWELEKRTCLPLNNKFGYRSEYRLMANEQTQAVYPYLRFNIQLRDDIPNCSDGL